MCIKDGAAFSKAYESDGSVHIVITDNLGRDVVQRIVAIDTEGNLHTWGGHYGSVSSEKMRQTTGTFPNLKLSQIKEFLFQTRPYQWLTFKNVSLQPGLKTDVQVEVEKPIGEKGKAVEEVDITPADFDVRLEQEREVCDLVVSIQNESSVTIPKFKLKFYRGNPSDNLDEASNIHSGWHEAGPIEPGKRWNESTRDFHLPDGRYEFNVLLDYDNSISETDETNNRASMTIVIKDGNIVEKSVKGIGALGK